MQIHEIKTIRRKKRKTVGRGGKRGTYSGRGNKGQKARSGAKINPLFEGGRSSLVERLKKVRGFKSSRAKKVTVNLDDIEKNFESGATVDIKSLIENGLLGKKESKRGVKILGTGKLTKKVIAGKDIAMSETAKKAIGFNQK